VTVKCQLCTVIIIDEEKEVTLIEVPAYTRDWVEFQTIALMHLHFYHEKSNNEAASLSTADFAMYLLAMASKEPTTQ
jgi:hypothetical protein